MLFRIICPLSELHGEVVRTVGDTLTSPDETDYTYVISLVGECFPVPNEYLVKLDATHIGVGDLVMAGQEGFVRLTGYVDDILESPEGRLSVRLKKHTGEFGCVLPIHNVRYDEAEYNGILNIRDMEFNRYVRNLDAKDAVESIVAVVAPHKPGMVTTVNAKGLVNNVGTKEILALHLSAFQVGDVVRFTEGKREGKFIVTKMTNGYPHVSVYGNNEILTMYVQGPGLVKPCQIELDAAHYKSKMYPFVNQFHEYNGKLVDDFMERTFPDEQTPLEVVLDCIEEVVFNPEGNDIVIDSLTGEGPKAGPTECEMIVTTGIVNAKGSLATQVGGDHYKGCGIQPVEYIQANKIGFLEGNIIKYATRHKTKGGADDVRKIIHYANLLLELEYEETFDKPNAE